MQPLIRLKRLVNNEIITVDIPAIDNVPVMFMHTKNFKIKVPIEKGDGVEIRFSEMGIGNFLNSTNGNLVDPDDISRFSLTDAICTPGLWGKNLPTNTPTIEVTESGELKFLAGISSFTKGEDLETLLNTFFSDSWLLLPPGTMVQNAAILTAMIASANAAKALVSGIKSTKIKGE